jgi:hypothetical protein
VKLLDLMILEGGEVALPRHLTWVNLGKDYDFEKKVEKDVVWGSWWKCFWEGFLLSHYLMWFLMKKLEKIEEFFGEKVVVWESLNV